MRILESVHVSVVQEHEKRVSSNARLGSYGMDQYCLPHQFNCFRTFLEQSDVDRLFLLGMFARYTTGHSCKVRDVLPHMSEDPRVASFIAGEIDLRSSENLELVVVTIHRESAPLVIIDGNHRAIAQTLNYGTIDGVAAFICEQCEVDRWPYIIRGARTARA